MDFLRTFRIGVHVLEHMKKKTSIVYILRVYVYILYLHHNISIFIYITININITKQKHVSLKLIYTKKKQHKN